MLRAATYIVFFLFALSGTLSVGAAVCRWRWFFETQNSRVMMRFFGRRGVRVFYLLLGLFVWAMAYVLYRDHDLF
ncbi:MAG TPA: immunity 17 family protein [Candidatus Caccoplasma intestinavium]|uniref:Immunity 17 family protein n=1 Tax=Candidatus Caccoplasma intestinavium TaxID=2840716 RepID=A0A9D1KF81_9BACT|nr:immunity 17 family protein [Candidatus Caccoplasma intestinavium]